MTTIPNKPYWFPQLTDDNWVSSIRVQYPDDTADLNDDEIRDIYADGCKYTNTYTWDNLGDARDCYEKLADAYLSLLERSGLEYAPR